MVALHTVNPGDEIVADDVNQFVSWLTGGSDINQAMALTQVDSATLYALTLKNLNASDRTLQVLDHNGVSQGEWNADGFRVEKLAVGPTILPTDQNTLLVTRASSDRYFQAVSIEVASTYTDPGGAAGDWSALRVVASQDSGDANAYAAEIHHHSRAGAVGHATILATLQGSTAITAPTAVGHAVIQARAFGATFGIPTPTRRGVAYQAGYDDEGFLYGFHYTGTGGEGLPLLFAVDQNGLMQSRGSVPTANITYDLGNSSAFWRDAYLLRTIAGAGTQGVPSLTVTGGSANTGLFFPTTTSVALTTSALEAFRIDSNGITDYRRTGNQFVALGGGAAATLGTIGGGGPAAAAQRSWLKILEAGVADFIPVFR